ncbi:MAG: non-canonical purine NTP pyrophosphatase, RdgB/HAM1 family [Synergistetes bacterium HGW-Synergistetes-2]|nr:MAG: non-canonical purine NTP pyrophosphatase, RdgB/HAM1 family [Synergistetes bacterium HGW-Synergistetes-2]
MRAPGMERLLFASGNRGKYVEVVDLFAPLNIDILYGPDIVVLDVEETGSSYESNAFLKAKAYAVASGMPALADDSGMEVRALNWEPGIFSARVAPTDGERIETILGRMRGVADRYACYVAAFALYFPSGSCIVTEGVCPGTLREAPAGDRGFGYDPVFSPSGYDRTFGELPDEVKRKISHRAVAGYRLMDILSGNCVVE